jgi:DNA invertase Pin-like site-specific DNA recombinase
MMGPPIERRAVMQRVAIYARVSTDEQTVANQQRELQAVADRHGWQIVATFTDEGISGTKGRAKLPVLIFSTAP